MYIIRTAKKNRKYSENIKTYYCLVLSSPSELKILSALEIEIELFAQYIISHEN